MSLKKKPKEDDHEALAEEEAITGDLTPTMCTYIFLSRACPKNVIYVITKPNAGTAKYTKKKAYNL